MSANFIRKYRANADYAVVPPSRDHLTTRALAPKSVSATRLPSTVAALQANTIRGQARPAERRGRGAQVLRKELATEFEIALIPVPVRMLLPFATATHTSQLLPIPVSTSMRRDMKLLMTNRHLELLRRLQTAGLLFTISLSLELEGEPFVRDLNEKVMGHLANNNIKLPPDPQPVVSDAPLTAHNLLFRFLELSKDEVDTKYRWTTVMKSLSLEVLTRTPFGKRIPNPLNSRFLLFIGKQCPFLIDYLSLMPRFASSLSWPSYDASPAGLQFASCNSSYRCTFNSCWHSRTLSCMHWPANPQRLCKWQCWS